jgi:hypothetical protein
VASARRVSVALLLLQPAGRPSGLVVIRVTQVALWLSFVGALAGGVMPS